MQKVLSFTKDKKKYVSKPFDFETMCLINDAHNENAKKGPLNICNEAVSYIFEGTEATQDVLNSIEPGVRARFCIELWNMYIEALSSKNE